jgi:hypothetical protein
MTIVDPVGAESTADWMVENGLAVEPSPVRAPTESTNRALLGTAYRVDPTAADPGSFRVSRVLTALFPRPPAPIPIEEFGDGDPDSGDVV